jgi:hypothetical protein
MQFFLFDFALAFVALLGYRTLVVVTRQGAPAGSLARTGKLHRRPGAAPWPDIARPRRRIEPQLVLRRRQEKPRRASLHRLINFW